MPSEVILPRVDMDMATGKISKWLVEPGATVAKGQPLFEIETDKATMEIEAEAAGTIRDLAAAGSKDIPVGSVVAWIFGADEAAAPVAEAAAAPAAMAPATKPDTALPPSEPNRVETQAEAASPPGRATSASAPQDGTGRLRATPLARRLARLYGIDLSGLTGSGPRGRIQALDIVVQRRDRAAEPAPVAETRPAPVPAPSPAKAPAATSAQAPVGLKRLRGGSGTPLLLVHGFGAEANGWRPFLQGQSFARPVYGLDLPGHGATPLGAVASFDDLVDTVGAALTELEGADVVAHSLGAAVMTAVAARGLADLRSLLLLAPAGLGPEINGGFIQNFVAARSEAALAPWMKELVTDPALITPALVRATLKLREGTDQVASQGQLAAAIFPEGTQGFSTRTDLARLRVPTRVVFGTADRIIPSRHAAGLPPLVALHLLPGIGHMPQIEAPHLVAAILGQITGV